jgi:hypothetical protein
VPILFLSSAEFTETMAHYQNHDQNAPFLEGLHKYLKLRQSTHRECKPDKNILPNYASEMVYIFLIFTLIAESLLGQWQEISARDHLPIYRIDVPGGWSRLDPSDQMDLSDTREPICSFSLGSILMVIHNFPSIRADERIPPGAQVQRWQQQFSSLDSVPVRINQTAFSGYAGLFFSAQGKQKKRHLGVIAWSVLLDPEHYRLLARSESSEQKRADITIKVTGVPEQLELYRDEIASFAESFELIEGIPMRL